MMALPVLWAVVCSGEGPVAEVDEVVVVVEVVQSEAEETGNGSGSRVEPEGEGTDVRDDRGVPDSKMGAGPVGKEGEGADSGFGRPV